MGRDERARDTLIAGAVPVLALVVASVQIFLALQHGLTPWRGGGFGMFSTADDPAFRVARFTLVTEDGLVPLDIELLAESEGLQRELEQLRTLPVEGHARKLADATTQRSWLVENGVATLIPAGQVDPPDGQDAFSLDHDGRRLTVDAVVVEVWAATYVMDRGTFEPQLIRQHTISVTSGSRHG